MKTPIILVAVVAALASLALAGCGEKASVQGVGTAKLTLVKPADVTLRRGGLTKVNIRIGRAKLPGNVDIHFANLPKGVDVVESEARIVGEEGVYTLRAGETADLVENHSANVTATRTPESISVTEPMLVNVKAKE